ncbi:MAG: hypothetical protein AB1468_06435 [Candidatus Micrarchaeota archaeon]
MKEYEKTKKRSGEFDLAYVPVIDIEKGRQERFISAKQTLDVYEKMYTIVNTKRIELVQEEKKAKGVAIV